MEDFVPKEDSLIKNATHTSDKVQSIQVRKLIPQVEKLRRESFPISPLSLNGSLTNVDICDTSFGKEVMEDMKTNNADIPDESFSEEIFLNDTKCQQKSANTTNADMPDASFSEEVLQDMDYGLDALRDAVPVLCLKKNEDSCDDADIFEEMSAFQVMGIFNNKDSKRTAKSINRKHEGKDNESKNKRSFPDKNIDSLYNNEENENPKSNDKLECTKHPGKKMDECDDVNDSMQDNEKDINNNDNECSMETTESGANEYDWVQKMMLTENDANQYNNCLGKETPEENCQMKEPDEDDKRKSTDQNYIKIKVKENIENASVVNSKDLKDNEVSIFCKKEGYKQPLDLPENVLDKDSCFNSNAPEGRPVQKEDASKEHKDKCIQSFRGTRRGELSDRSEITNLNDSMRNIKELNNCKTAPEGKCGTAIEANLERDSSSLKCSSCEFTSPKKFLLQQHHVFYHDKWLFQCLDCNSGYNTKGAFERHRLAHLECKIRKRKFKCSRCSQTFFFRLSLQKHLKNHKNKEENMKSLQQRRPKQKKIHS